MLAPSTGRRARMLQGADNRTFPNTYHNDLRLSPAIVAGYRAFLESAEVPVPASTAVPAAPPAPGSGSTLPATGPAVPGLPVVGALALALGLLTRRRIESR